MKLLPITDEIKNGEPVLMKFRSDIRAEFYPDGGRNDLKRYEGIWAVLRRRSPDEYDDWGFAAPVGVGGFPDDWFDGWLPLPSVGGAPIEEIAITTESDRSDCDTCGFNFDEGGRVRVNGKLAFEYKPLASCCGNANYDEGDLLYLALDAVGVKISVDGETPFSLTKYSLEGE